MPGMGTKHQQPPFALLHYKAFFFAVLMLCWSGAGLMADKFPTRAIDLS